MKVATLMALASLSEGVLIPRGSPRGPAKCPECGKVLSGRIGLSQHLRDKHGRTRRESK